MKDIKHPSRLVEIINEHKHRAIFDAPSADFADKGPFVRITEAQGNFYFSGTSADYSKLKKKLMEEMNEGRRIDVLGWQDEGFWAFNNCALNGRVIDFTPYGTVDVDGVHFYVPSANEHYRDADSHINQKKCLYIDRGHTFRKVAKKMLDVHGERSMLALCFVVATCFSDHIFSYHRSFPLLFFYGPASTGKGKLAQTMQCFFGQNQDSISIAGANTDKGKILMLAEFRNLVMFMDEYRNDIAGPLKEQLKNLWDRIGYRRGNIERKYGSETVPVRCSVVMAGNYYPDEDALLTRLLIEEFEEPSGGFSEKQLRAFNDLSDIVNDGFSSVLMDILRHRGKVVEEYVATFKDVKKDIGKLFAGNPNVSERMVQNAATLAAVFRVLEEELPWPFKWAALKKHIKQVLFMQSEKRELGADVQKWWDIFLKNVRDPKAPLTDQQQFKVKDGKLYIIFKMAYNEFPTVYSQMFKSGPPSQGTMRDLLKKSPAFLKDYRTCRIGDSVTSALCFDLQGTGIENELLVAIGKALADDGFGGKIETEEDQDDKAENEQG